MTHPFRDPTLPLHDRARDLLGRLDPGERVAMLHQVSPGVERLGLAPFRTGTEGLHGVAWLGTATVFPQPVGLAATWDTELLRRVGDAVATEVRAKHAADPTISLNVWAPVVNPLRHPRWGRTEEGWSEDAHLTAHLGGAFAAGLRGDHPAVWKTVPTLKHFLAYGHETDRAVTSSNLTLRTLHEHELAAYRGPVEAGAVGAVMPAYNLVDGRPCHVSGELFDELRRWADASLDGSLAVVSDAAAPTNLVTGERYFDDHVTSHAAALRAGVDSFTDNDADAGPTVARITAALDRGLLTAEDVDRAVLRLLELRLRTGELDGDADPYARIGPDALDLPAHRTLAQEASSRAVVLLRNEGVLPLGRPAAPTRVAVVGPLADRVLTDWYSGTPPYAVDVAAALRERWPGAEVTVATGADVVALRSTTAHAYLTVSEDGDAGPVLAASSPDAAPATHLEVTDWGDGLLTLRAVARDRLLTGAGWIVRATATRVGGWVAQESFRRHHHTDGTWSLQHVGSGRWLRVQHGSGLVVAEAHSPAEAERFTARTVRSGHADVATAAAGADAVVVVVGNDPHLAGRETEDRPHLRLPDAAVEVWRTAREAHPDAVLALVSSYPYVLGAETADARAVLWSCHGGQELGHGIGDVLAGDVEPAGRLAQTWPAAGADPGDLLDHDLADQHATYRFADAEPAFAFGHGLTYTTVEYTDLVLERSDVDAPAPTHAHPAYGDVPAAPARSVRARVSLRNTGARPAHELVQLYVLAGELPVPGPRRLLVAHERVVLEPGEAREVTLAFDVARLAVWDVAELLPGAPADWVHAGALRVQPGSYTVAAGTSAAELPVRAALRVTGSAPRVRRIVDEPLQAHAFHAGTGVVVGDLSREAGACVEVPAGGSPGVVRYDGVDLDGCSTARLRLAATRTAASPVRLDWRPAGERHAPWLPLATAVVPRPVGVDSRYRWQEAAAALHEAPVGPVDVRVTLPPGARLAAISA
ncbi:beta-glucosidase [Isoptericola sp. CG 20/1183]|uniref:Beta-glucosidase n=1 Tax=Isoptericola halotolerans TaxID=300560 RepID=A0ABX5EBG6_9MICO|nr:MULTISPECIES: glycoside hydrolase family 3 C-terminal domain-containing protein [Isoptericola]PRZ04848.1 beta-glucosidase [Isoptericola halotolerans]PRZ05339.1 beta-glucosidase [Isoptericola sp. CG 20/1183]